MAIKYTLRDPRRDPEPRDVMQLDLGDFEYETYEVVRVDRAHGGTVICIINGDRTRTRSVKLRQWRELMSDASMIR